MRRSDTFLQKTFSIRTRVPCADVEKSLELCKGAPSRKRYGEQDTRTIQTEDVRERPRRGSRLCRRTTDSSTDEDLTRAGTSAQ